MNGDGQVQAKKSGGVNVFAHTPELSQGFGSQLFSCVLHVAPMYGRGHTQT
jgi:hypothetical protein